MKRFLLILLAVLGLSACQQAYYNTMEKFGVYKRDILVDRVEQARDSQIDTKEQFQSALERFRELTEFNGGDLGEIYDRLNKEYEKSEAQADEVHQRIEAVRDVAEDLFDEWEDELDDYSNDNFRKTQAQELSQSRQRYQQLMTSMERAEARIPPVLSAFKDQVLYLKHSLNAQAIASLKTELIGVQTDISQLITAMEQAIRESDAFIDSLDGSR